MKTDGIIEVRATSYELRHKNVCVMVRQLSHDTDLWRVEQAGSFERRYSDVTDVQLPEVVGQENAIRVGHALLSATVHITAEMEVVLKAAKEKTDAVLRLAQQHVPASQKADA